MIPELRKFFEFDEKDSREQLDIVYKFGTADERKAFARGQINEWTRTKHVVECLIECVRQLQAYECTCHPDYDGSTCECGDCEALANLRAKLEAK